MRSNNLQQYVTIVEFLGKTLGPDYEVVLQDLNPEHQAIVAIANGHISGRQVGSPLTDASLQMLTSKAYESNDFLCNYRGIAVNGHVLRSSTMFIKDDKGTPIGFLCINFDDSRYRTFAQQVLSLCHPNPFFQAQERPEEEEGPLPRPETFRNSTEAVTQDAIAHELERLGVPAERLTSEERLHVIAALEESGIFLLKGAVKDVAAGLGCSQASVYRYLSQIRK